MRRLLNITLSSRTSRAIILGNVFGAMLILGLGLTAWHASRHGVDKIIIQAAREVQIDPRLVACVIWKESRFDPAALGAAGEIGLMQIMPATGAEWAQKTGQNGFAPEGLLDPLTNVRAGSWYLARGIEDWKDQPIPEAVALAQYNAGRSNVLRWLRAAESNQVAFVDAITYPGTRDYVEDILGAYGRRIR